jgi:hypothetical protein
MPLFFYVALDIFLLQAQFCAIPAIPEKITAQSWQVLHKYNRQIRSFFSHARASVARQDPFKQRLL